MRVSLLRSRWAALGAAVAVGLGAGGLGLAGAASPPANPVTTLISPCRLMDTRPGATNVGTRATPLGPGETSAATVWGTNGQCTIPTNATGIVANVTIVSPTASSYLTVWPSDKTRPTASNLNWVAGQAPTANQVTTALSVADGRISLFNLAGTVHVIVDITGYLTPADLSNYYTKAQVDAANASQNSTIAALQTTVSSLQANTYTKAQVDAATACKGYPRQILYWPGCYLEYANLTGQNLDESNLVGADLYAANLTQASFFSTNLSNAKVSSTNLYYTAVVHTILTGADLSNSNWTHTDARFVQLDNADLTGTVFDSANLTGALGMTTANLTGTTWTNTTCPDGTNSDAHGTTCVGHL